jgi:hypothetical protein
LHGYEAWSLTLREEHRLKVCENRVLRRIFVLDRDDVVGSWIRLQNGEPHNLYASPNIIRVINKEVEMGGACSICGRFKNAYKIFVGKPEGYRPL